MLRAAQLQLCFFTSPFERVAFRRCATRPEKRNEIAGRQLSSSLPPASLSPAPSRSSIKPRRPSPVIREAAQLTHCGECPDRRSHHAQRIRKLCAGEVRASPTRAPVVFDDVRPSDPELHRRTGCLSRSFTDSSFVPTCALTSNFYGRKPIDPRAGRGRAGQHSDPGEKDHPGRLRRRQRTFSPMFPMPTRSPYSSGRTSLPLWEKAFFRSSPEIWFVPRNRIRIQRWRCSSIQCNGDFHLLPLRPVCVSDTRRDDEQQSELDRRYPFSAARSLA